MKFSKEFMFEVLCGNKGKIIQNKIIDTGRWSIYYDLTFKLDDKYYNIGYSEGATEQQDESPWEGQEKVDCTEVEPVEKTVTVFEPIKK